MKKRKHRWTSAILFLALVMMISMAGCSKTEDTAEDTGNDQSGDQVTESVIDYMVLVNKENPLPEGWEEALDLTTITNSVGDEVQVESTAYEAYLQLKDALEKEGIHTELDSAYRSVEAQQKIVDEFTEKYGEDYVKEYVAVPGYSEHHTGLALDLYLIVDDKTVYENEDLVQYPEIWAKIHEKLPEYGFILRYPQDKDGVTGYSYEPWHIRYIGSPEIAKEITEKGITFEEYLNDSK